MMSSRGESKTDDDLGNSSSRRFLHDIEQISKRLNLHRKSIEYVAAPTHNRSKSNDITVALLHKDKKSSIWKKSWNALSHIRNRRFGCWFFLHVHSVEGLPSEFENKNIRVYWNRKHDEMQTHPAKVSRGKAQFEETLMHRCSVYGSKNGHNHSAKYEPKIFLIYVMVLDATILDVGKHRIDLTKLLPLTLEELENKKSSGKWTSSFKLSGRAKGGVLNVSFGFSVRHNHLSELGNTSVIPRLLRESKSNIRVGSMDVAKGGSESGRLQRVGSSANNSKRYLLIKSQSLDSNILENNCDSNKYTVAEGGTQMFSKVPLILDGAGQTSGAETIDVEEIFEDDRIIFGENKGCLIDDKSCDNKNHAANGNTIQEGDDMENIDVKEIFEDDETEADGWTGFNLTGKDYYNNDGHRTEYQVDGMYNKVKMLENSHIEIIDVKEIFKDDDIIVDEELLFNSIKGDYSDIKDDPAIGLAKYVENDPSTEKTSIGKNIPGNLNISVIDLGDSEALMDINEHGINIFANNSLETITRSRGLDVIRDSVEKDFFKSLAIEENPLDQNTNSDPESPRGLLLRQFEEEALISGKFIINDDSEEENVGIRDGDDSRRLSLFIRVDDKEDGITNFANSLRIKKDAELLEYTETKALMKEWGFNENVFQNSPDSSSGGFGSPVYRPVEEPVEFPPLGEGLGSTIRTKDGGFLRSMNSLLFKNAKNNGKLIMQVSAPVVLPAAMGSSIMEILQLWASVGYEKMYMQVEELMPLEDISGKMLQQVAWEITSRSEATDRSPYLQESEDEHGFIDLKRKIKGTPFSWGCDGLNSTFFCDGMDIDYVSFEGLAPLAMNKIETMLIEGLRIQSGVAEEDAPSIIEPQSLGKPLVFLGGNIAEHIGESEDKDRADDLDDLISLSLKLDEWMRFDAGDFDSEDEVSERISNIMEAHLVGNMELDSPTLIQDKITGKNCGLLGNNFTVALRVQLRDPLRDYETVGSSMVSLVEVERVFLDPKPIIHCKVSDGDDDEENYAIFNQDKEENNDEETQTIMDEATPLFKITEVHVAGFSIEPVRKHSQGTISQEHSGLRWLLASRMGEMKKLINLKKNALIKSYSHGARKTRPTDSLWSISSHVHSPEAKWKELATVNVHIRNPDVIFLN